MRGQYASALVLTLVGITIILRTFNGTLVRKVQQWTSSPASSSSAPPPARTPPPPARAPVGPHARQVLS